MSTADYATFWVQRGYYPIPLPYREKGPKAENWQHLHLTAEDIPRYFNGQPLNIGVLQGEPYGNCDIDLDSAQAVAAWPHFAPETGLIFGRKSKPRSHYFYRIDPPTRSRKYLDPTDGATLLEFRCLKHDGTVGLQTMVPPSVHPSGEAIEFWRDCNRDPANVDASELGRTVRWTAAAALLARHWPQPQGGRHDAFLALAGALARSQWGLNEATQLVCGLYQTLWPGSADLYAAAREVESTFQRHDDGGEITGFPHLEKLVSRTIAQQVAKWLELRREPEAKPAFHIRSVPSIWNFPKEEINWTWEDYIMTGSVNMITGDSGVGKSTLMLALAGAIAHGKAFLGRPTKPHPVLYVDRENMMQLVRERLGRLQIEETSNLIIWGMWCDPQPVRPVSDAILEFVKAEKPVLVYDSFIAFSGYADEQNATEMRRYTDQYRQLAALGATILVPHNVGKSETAKLFRGSSDIKANFDAAYLLESLGAGTPGTGLDSLRLVPFKTRVEPPKPMRFDYANGVFTPAEGPAKSPEEIIHDGLRLNPGCTQKELTEWAAKRGVGINKTRSVLEPLVLDGKVLSRRGRNNTIRYYLPDTGPQLVMD